MAMSRFTVRSVGTGTSLVSAVAKPRWLDIKSIKAGAGVSLSSDHNSITVSSVGLFNVVAFTAASKTLALTDAQTIQDSSNVATQTITIPLDASVLFPVGTIIVIEQNGAGNVLVSPTGGVTLNGGTAAYGLNSQYTSVYLRKEAANTWFIEGANAVPSTTMAGTTAGSVIWAMPSQQPFYKVFIARASGYENNTAVNQAITFPTAFTNTPTIVSNDTSLTLTASTSTLTITAPNSVTVFNGNIYIVGF